MFEAILVASFSHPFPFLQYTFQASFLVIVCVVISFICAPFPSQSVHLSSLVFGECLQPYHELHLRAFSLSFSTPISTYRIFGECLRVVLIYYLCPFPLNRYANVCKHTFICTLFPSSSSISSKAYLWWMSASIASLLHPFPHNR